MCCSCVGRDVEAEALERVEQESAPHLDRRGAPAQPVVDRDRARLRGRQIGMRRDRERDEAVPLDVVPRHRSCRFHWSEQVPDRQRRDRLDFRGENAAPH
jgi:hypothetical protein